LLLQDDEGFELATGRGSTSKSEFQHPASEVVAHRGSPDDPPPPKESSRERRSVEAAADP
jgi:hypothetical protein